MALILEDRVTNLETLMSQFIQEQRIAQRRADEERRENRQSLQQLDKLVKDIVHENRQSQRRTDELIETMQQSWLRNKEETDRIIADIRAQISADKEETNRIIANTQSQIAADKAKTDRIIANTQSQIAADKAKTDREIKNSRRQYGELSNRLGTLVEDLIVPSIPQIVRKVVKQPAEQIECAIRVKRYDAEGKEREFDAIASCGPYFLINETKSRLSPEAIQTFVNVLPKIRQYFPEYADKQIIGIVSSLYVDESLVRYGERQGLVVLGFGKDVMDILNSFDFQPKLW